VIDDPQTGAKSMRFAAELLVSALVKMIWRALASAFISVMSCGPGLPLNCATTMPVTTEPSVGALRV